MRDINETVAGKSGIKSKIKTLTASTNGKGYYTDQAKKVRITEIRISRYMRSKNVRDKPLLQMEVYFNTKDWNTKKDDLIYGDEKWISELRKGLQSIGFVATGLDYTEQGMQEDDFVSVETSNKAAVESFLSILVNKNEIEDIPTGFDEASDYNCSKESKETLDESAWLSVAEFAAWTIASGLAASIIAMVNIVVTDGTLFDPIIEKWQDRVYGGKLSADGAKSFISDLEKMIPSLPKHKQKYMRDGIKKLKKIAASGDKTELGKQASHMGLQMNLKLHDMPNQNESHCGCSKKAKETADEEEFEMQLKNKKKLTESIIKKFRFGSK